MRVLVFFFALLFSQETALASAPRLETEAKLNVPEAIAQDVWPWLAQTFPPHCSVGESRFQCERESESFYDTYFDNGSADLSNIWTGVRHRRRTYDNGDTKELMQIKVTPKNSETTREEIKFSVREGRKVVIEEDAHPLLQRLPRDKREKFIKTLNKYDVDAMELRPVLPLSQIRKRIYVGDPDPMLTITFDEMTSQRLWIKDTAYEIEVEINENLYTDANDEERLKLEESQQAVLEGLLQKFPQITQDQTPKYTKMFNRVFDQIPFGRTLLKWGLL